MKRYAKAVSIFVCLILFTVTAAFAMQDGQSTITVTVEDDYTNDPVESVLVRLLDGGNEIASGTTDLTGRTELVISVTSNEEPDNLIPESFQVSESYPNPFEQSSSVNLQIEEPQEVQAEIYNIIGQRVASIQVNLTPGTYTLLSSLGHLAQGVYFLRILGTQSQTIKMTKVGDRIFSGGSILNINPATFVTRNGPGVAGLALDGHAGRSLTLVTSNRSYNTYQQSIQIASDTTVTVEMSRNNEVIVRVADEGSPSQDVETTLTVDGDGFSQQISSPDTLSLKSGFYTLSADEDNTAAFSQQVEIASEDQTITVLTQVKTLADDQLQLEGLITDESTGNPIDRAYIYLLNQTTSDTLAGPLFAGSDGLLDAIANLDNGPDLDLSILYRKAGYTDFETSASVSLPDTLDLTSALQPAPAPTASFSVTGEQRINMPLIFDASASTGVSGEDLVYSWDFGNGKRGFGETISFVYSDNGSYDVTLTVAGEFGASDIATDQVSISGSSTTSSTIINGEISSIDQSPIKGVTAQVVNDDLQSISGTDGRIILPDIPAGVPIVVKLTKDGYATQTVRITPDEDSGENFFTASIVPLEEPQVITAIETGTDRTGKFGTRVSLPVDALVDSNGDVVTGDVELSMTPLDVSSDEIFAFPGGFDGLRPTGELGQLVSFGVADYTFTQNGETLQMMPGKTATIEIPVTNANVNTGDIIPLWTLDEDTGLWIEEGNGEIIASADSPSGLAMITSTGHFSWKNIDVFQNEGIYTLVPRCRNGETNIFISCTIRGNSVNPDGTSSGYAPVFVVPADGNYQMPVPLNRDFVLEASSGSGFFKGSATILPVSSPGTVIERVVDLFSTATSEEISIAYGDLLKGKSTSEKSSRYVFEGEQGDYIKIRVREALGFEGFGDVILLDDQENVLSEGNYRNNFSRYLFETLPKTGTYTIVVLSESETSNFDIELDLFDGPVNREISYGDRIFDFLWPGTTNTYTFDGQTEDVIELIARSVQGEGSLFGKLKLNTPNPLVSDSTTFFEYNAWVYRLEEKDGIYELEVSGAESDRFGEYILDFNTVSNLVESGSDIAYGDSILVKATNADPANSFTFEGTAGDRIRLHFDKPYPESDNRLLTTISLTSPSMDIIYETRNGFDVFRNEYGFGFILPENGVYTLNTDSERISSPDAEGELFSLLLKEFVNPITKELTDDTLFDELFSTGLNLNQYTFNGGDADFSRLTVRASDGGTRSQGSVMLFDENYQLIEEGNYSGGSSGSRSIFDFETTNQEYTVIVTNRERIQESYGRIAYAVSLGSFNGGFIEFNTPLSTTLEPNEFKVFSFENEFSRREVSISAVGFNDIEQPVYILNPFNQRPRIFFNGSQSDYPTILEERGNYLLFTEENNSGSSIPIDLSIVSLEWPATLPTITNGTNTVEGELRVNGDIDRFDFTEYSNGDLKISLLPTESNSIDDSGNLKIRLNTTRDPVRLITPEFEDTSPEGPELYIWEGRISPSVEYRIHVWDQAAITSGNFKLEIEFTPDP